MKTKRNLSVIVFIFLLAVFEITLAETAYINPSSLTIIQYIEDGIPGYTAGGDYQIGRLDESGVEVRYRTRYEFSFSIIPRDARINSVKISYHINNGTSSSYKARFVKLPNAYYGPEDHWGKFTSSQTTYASGLSYNSSYWDKTYAQLTADVTSAIHGADQLLCIGFMSENEGANNTYANVYIDQITVDYSPKITVTVQNNFNGGKVAVDGQLKDSPWESTDWYAGDSHNIRAYTQTIGAVTYPFPEPGTWINLMTSEVKYQENNNTPVSISPVDNCTWQANFDQGTVHITVDQKLSSETSVGSVSLWEGESDFTDYTVPKSFDFPLSSNQVLRAEQGIISGEKYNHWQKSSDPVADVKNHHVFSIDESFPDYLTARFMPTHGSITIQVDFEGTSENYDCPIEFKDPWFIDYADPNYGDNYRNRGNGALFRARATPFVIDYSTTYENGQSYKGVFLDQNQYFEPDKPIYRLKAPNTYANTEYIYEFDYWQGTDLDFGGGNTITHSRITDVVFKEAGASAEAHYRVINDENDHTLIVPSDETLTIPANANISFANNFKIEVKGKIISEGTDTHPVNLDGYGKQTPGLDGSEDADYSLICAKGNNPEITLNNTIIKNIPCAIKIMQDEAKVVLENVNIENSNYGIYMEETCDSRVKLLNSVFENCDCGFVNNDPLADEVQRSAVLFHGCEFSNISERGLYIFQDGQISSGNDSELNVYLNNCIFYNNLVQGIYYYLAGDEYLYGKVIFELINCIFDESDIETRVDLQDNFDGVNIIKNNSYLQMEDNFVNVITADPKFIDINNSDLRLCHNSPGIDAGGQLPFLCSNDLSNDFTDYCNSLPLKDDDDTYYEIGAHYYPQLDKSGTVSSDETWYGGMTITGDVTVSSGVELTIDPGSKIMFNQGRGMKVYGTLTADGLSSAHIIFTRSDPSNNNKSFWDEITIESSGHYLLDYVEMYGSYLGFHPRNSSNHYIKNSHFEKNFVGVYPYNSDNTTIYNCDFIDNTYGTYNWSSSGLDINHCHYNNNSSYALYFNGSSGEVNKNTIENTSNYDGIMVSGGGDPDLSTVYDPYHVELNNSIEDNGRHGVNIYQGSYADLGTKLFTGTEIFGGFNYFDHGSGNYDVRNDNNYDIYAQVNWWEDMNVTSDVETDPTAEDLGYGLPKASGIDQPDYIDDLFFQAYKLEKVDSNYTVAINVLNEIANEVPNDPRCKKAIIRLARLYHKLDDRAGFIENLDYLYDIYPEQCVGLAALDRSVTVWMKNREFEEALARAAELLDKYNSVGDYDQEISAILFKQAMIYQDMDSTANLSKPAKVLAEENFAKILSDYPESEQAHLIQELFNVQAPDKEIIDIPMEFALHPAYPNPFNPSTTIRFNLPEAAKVKIAVYDMLGREIWQQETMYRPDYHQIVWNGVNQANDPVASGVYLIQLTSKKYNATTKVLLMK